MYEDPLQDRYGSDQMREIWGEFNKFAQWRRLWVSLSEAQSYTKMVDIPDKTIRKMREETFNIDIDKIKEYEKEVGHDVYAAILEFHDKCGSDHGKFIHLGATSQFVVDNGDCIRIRQSLDLIVDKMKELLGYMCLRAESLKDRECVGYTHGQKAQLTTIGRRISMWGESIAMCLDEIIRIKSEMKWRGAKGAVGNQTGYCYMNPDTVIFMEEYLCERFEFSPFSNCGQTYHRTQDIFIASSMVASAAAMSKMAQDIRLLCAMGEMSEKKTEVGSSAMPYKTNPITSEKVCSLSRMVLSLFSSFAETASTQWLERSLDDSANRRVSFPKMFIMVDEMVKCCIKLIDEATFYDQPDKVNEHLPYAVMEWVVTKAVINGYDRVEMHEKMRQAANSTLTGQHLINNVLSIPELKGVDTKEARTAKIHLGNSVKQVEKFISTTRHKIYTRMPVCETL